RAHRDPNRLPIRAERIQRCRIGVFATELEDVADLDAAVDGQRRSALRAWVTGADFGSLDRPIGLEVTPRDNIGGVPIGLVRPGDPRGADDDPRVDEIADAEVTQDLRADVPAEGGGVPWENPGPEHRGGGGVEIGLQPLHVDLAVSWHTDNEELGVL